MAAIAFAAAVGGCGGSSATYDRAATAACLPTTAVVDSVSTRKDDLDMIAEEALGGGIRVTFLSGNEVMLSFSRTGNDASRIFKEYELFAAGTDSPVRDILKEEGNVVIAFDSSPTSAESDAVTGCLKTAR